MIYSENASSMVLGALLKNAQLINNPKYPLCKADFEPVRFHKGIYVCIAKLAIEGVVECSGIEIENVSKDNPVLYNVLIDNDYLDFVEQTKELANVDSFESFYNKVRKLSLLRDLKESGKDISPWYDEIEEREKEDFTISDILTDIDKTSDELRNKYDINFVRSEMYAGDDTEGLLQQFEEEPTFGADLTSPYQTSIYRGWCRGHLLLRGAKSGLGKTRLAVADLMNVGAKQIWNDTFQDFIDNDNYQGSTFFIHTEQETRTEINPMFLACVSGVGYNTIIDGKYTDEERKRILKAGEILKDSNIRLTYMPEFTAKRIDEKIAECIRNDGTAYGVFDYIWLNSANSIYYKDSMGSSVRPDMVLTALSASLKEAAEKYNVGIMTAMQLNRGYEDAEFPNASCLAGSMATQDKIDGGSIMLPAKEKAKSYKKIEPFLVKKGFTGDKEGSVPNICEFVLKARYKSIGYDRIKIWSYIDRSTMRRKDFFCTDGDDEIINIPIMKRGI